MDAQADRNTEMDQALAALAGTTADSRRDIYARLRRSLAEKLEGEDPPLPLRDQLAARKRLEDRIMAIERAALADVLGKGMLPLRQDTRTDAATPAIEHAPQDEPEFDETVVRVSLEKETSAPEGADDTWDEVTAVADPSDEGWQPEDQRPSPLP